MREADLPSLFAGLAARAAAEARRGASRVDPPEQEVARGPDGRLTLTLPPAQRGGGAERGLVAGVQPGGGAAGGGTGLFRVMPEPGARAVARLRYTAAALSLAWPAALSHEQSEHGLDITDPQAAAMMTAIRRAGGRASYQPWRAGVPPWHAAVAPFYAHATAPLRRLANRAELEAALAVANGHAVPDCVRAAFVRMPEPMARAGAMSRQLDRAAVDLTEAAVLQGRKNELFTALATNAEAEGARIKLVDLPVVARVAGAGVAPGARLRVQLTAADPEKHGSAFSIAEGTDG